jgi:predicted permease
VLLGAVGLLLLIACGNAANLLLARSEVRVGEVALRTALGAGRARIVRQLLTESLLLATLGGAFGFAVAWAGVRALLAVDPNAVPRTADVQVDGPVILFALAVVLCAALLFGLVPAIRVARSGLAVRLRDTGRRGLSPAGSGRLQSFLVTAQVAMAVVLLTASGLMMRSFAALLQADPGFGAESVLTLRITAPAGRYPDAEGIARFYESLKGGVEDLPGVASVGAVRLLPLATTMGTSTFRPVDYVPAPNEGTQAEWQWVMAGYFETAGIPLLDGRTFDPSDRRDTPSVVVVSRELARRYWGDASPVGRRVVAFGGDTAAVIGVVGDVRHAGVTAEANPTYYRVHSQITGAVGTMRSMSLVIGTDGDPASLVEPVRGVLRSVDPAVPLSQVRTLDDIRSASVAASRFSLILMSAFGGLALLLAVVGIYGMLSYSVSRRRPEIGVRMALGAEPRNAVRLVVRQCLVMAALGIVVGAGITWVVGDVMSGLLYGVAAQDPATLVAVPALFLSVALVACWIPAVRAARVQPASALRVE